VEEAGGPEREMFAYHWHSNERTAITFPHFHLYQGSGAMRDEVRKAHVPTGRLAFEDVLRLDFGHFSRNKIQGKMAAR
jgi:hypothetical protein